MNLTIILVGALGGIAPTLLKLAIDLTRGTQKIPDISGSLLLGMLIFGILGGIVAGVWGEKDFKKVFYIGLGLPSLLTVANSTASTPAGPAPAKQVAWLSHTRVFAATNPIAGRRLKVTLPPEVSAAQPQVAFDGETGQQTAPLTSDVPIPVPPSAKSFLIRSSIGSSNPVPLPETPSALLQVKVTAEKNTWYGLQYAIGIHSDPYTLAADASPRGNVVASLAAKEPIAVAYLPTGVLVLQKDGSILKMEDGVLKVVCTIPASYSPFDLTAGVFANTPRAFVSGNAGAGSVKIASLFLVDSRKPTSEYFTMPPKSGQLSGLTADSASGTIYAANPMSRQIYAWGVTSSAPISKGAVAEVRPAVSMGSLAFDSAKRRLFVADPQDQKIYTVALTPGAAAAEFTDLNQTISALAIDQSQRKMYVGGGDKLVSVMLDSPAKVTTLISGAKVISGLAVDSDHGLWVSDEKLGEVEKLVF